MEGQLINGGSALQGTISLTKPSTTASFLVGGKYVAKPIELTLNVSAGSATTPSTTITANPSISVNETGKITALASASRSITPTVSAGWVASGTAGSVTVSGSSELQIDSAVGSNAISGGAVTCDLGSSSNIVISKTDTYSSGILVNFTGSRAQATATAKVTTAGFAALNNSFATATLSSGSAASGNYYVQGITLTKPTSGTRQFDITVPNGNSTITFHYSVDSNGNTTITEG